jgi:TrmH family RNA methyltransferase
MACTWDDFDAFRTGENIAVWGADAAGAPLDRHAAPPPRLALVMGNEGNGLSPAACERIQTSVALPVSSAVESLNVAVATGIFLYQLRP